MHVHTYQGVFTLIEINKYKYKIQEKMSISVDVVEISEPVKINGTSPPTQQVRILPLGHPDSKMNPTLSYDYVRIAQQSDIEIKAIAVYLKYKSMPSMPLLRTFVQSWAPNCKIEKGLVMDKGDRTLAPHDSFDILPQLDKYWTVPTDLHPAVNRHYDSKDYNFQDTLPLEPEAYPSTYPPELRVTREAPQEWPSLEKAIPNSTEERGNLDKLW